MESIDAIYSDDSFIVMRFILEEAKARRKKEKDDRKRLVRDMEVKLIELGIKQIAGSVMFEKWFKGGGEDDLPLSSN